MSTAAQQFAEWIGNTHPDFYSVLYSYVARKQAARQFSGARLRGFADDSFDVDSGLDLTPDYTIDTSGSASSLIDSGTDVGGTDLISSQYSPASVDIATLTSTDLGAPTLTSSLPAPSGTLDVATDNSSGGFLQSIGSGIASAASSVGNFLTSAQGLTDVTKLATAYFQLQTNKVNAQVQTQVLQAQATRAANGASPVPITYALASNGQLVPIYSVAAGSALPVALANAVQAGTSQYITTPNGVSGYTIPSNVVSSLSGTTSLTSVLPWVALIVGGLILAKGLSK